MLRQLDSRQLAEMYAYHRIELIPQTEQDKAKQRAKQLRAMFEQVDRANSSRTNH